MDKTTAPQENAVTEFTDENTGVIKRVLMKLFIIQYKMYLNPQRFGQY